MKIIKLDFYKNIQHMPSFPASGSKRFPNQEGALSGHVHAWSLSTVTVHVSLWPLVLLPDQAASTFKDPPDPMSWILPCDGYFRSAWVGPRMPRYLVKHNSGGVCWECLGMRLTPALVDWVKQIVLLNVGGPHPFWKSALGFLWKEWC